MLTATPNQLAAGMTGTTAGGLGSTSGGAGSTSGGAGTKPGASQKDMAAWFRNDANYDIYSKSSNLICVLIGIMVIKFYGNPERVVHA